MHHHPFRPLLALAAAWLLAAAPNAARAEPAAKAVPAFSVFVDLPTGFVFVKLPAGWKFVGHAQPADTAQLPATVLTSLLEDEREPGADRLAAAR